MKRPLVVKLGTSLIVDGARHHVRRQVLRERGREIAQIVKDGTPVCVVSSGAIALGLPRLGLDRRPRSMPRLQAASALGQARLHAAWEEALAPHRVSAAQILLTSIDVAERATYVNARNALNALFALGAVPIVNENDTTATDEITFGDNDALAAQVAVLTRARLLVLLTEVEGVLSRAPGPPRAAGEPRGTRVAPDERAPSAFKVWLRFGQPVSGRLRVDDGAKAALVNDGASLLAVGVARCEGRFEAGDGVEIIGPDGVAFAKGIASAGAAQLRRRPRGLEVVHRDRLVLY